MLQRNSLGMIQDISYFITRQKLHSVGGGRARIGSLVNAGTHNIFTGKLFWPLHTLSDFPFVPYVMCFFCFMGSLLSRGLQNQCQKIANAQRDYVKILMFI